MAFTALAAKAYKGPIDVVWANSIQGNFDWLLTGVAKAWVVFDGSAAALSARASQNISSITDNGVGRFDVNFTTGFQSSGLVAQFTVESIASGTNGDFRAGCIDVSAANQGIASSTVSIRVSNGAGNTLADCKVHATFFGLLK